eukprot:s5776_g1.t1
MPHDGSLIIDMIGPAALEAEFLHVGPAKRMLIVGLGVNRSGERQAACTLRASHVATMSVVRGKLPRAAVMQKGGPGFALDSAVLASGRAFKPPSSAHDAEPGTTKPQASAAQARPRVDSGPGIKFSRAQLSSSVGDS